MLAQDVFEHTRARTIGVFGLGDLTELQRIAEQDQVLRGVGRGDGVGERQLTGLVDDEDVDGERSKSRAAHSHVVPATKLYSSLGRPFSSST